VPHDLRACNLFGFKLQQGFSTGEMGFKAQFAQQQSWAAHVRFGSKADMKLCNRDVRFTPKSGHWNSAEMSALCQQQTSSSAIAWSRSKPGLLGFGSKIDNSWNKS
jgi:hypothetical protein